MKLYLFIIGISVSAIAALNVAFSTASTLYILIAVAFCTVLQFVLDGIIALVINKLPNRWFGIYNPLYKVSRAETEMYKRLGVRRWKDKIVELGGLGGFSKRELSDPYNPAYIEKFIIECNKGVLTHRLIYPVGFLVMLAFPNICSLTIALPVALVNLVLNVLPTIALRCNTPILIALYERLLRRKGNETGSKINTNN